jgi:TPP-dependent pyruvate/acetoin dehydrogenase alpha subunit
LLTGVPEQDVKAAILAGRSITLSFPSYRFLTSAIVGGILPIALGVALAIKRAYEATPEDDRPTSYPRGIPRVHAFVGDMTAMTGAYHETREYAYGHNLPLNLVTEDNGKSVGTPTLPTWGDLDAISVDDYELTGPRELRLVHTNPWPHAGAGKWVRF